MLKGRWKGVETKRENPSLEERTNLSLVHVITLLFWVVHWGRYFEFHVVDEERENKRD